MTNWTLETLEDFEGVFFDAGMGWKVLFEIHLAISLRAKYTFDNITNFNTQISGIVWTDDDDADDSRDLKTELRHCYNAIVSMMDSPQTEFGGHHWTHASGRSEVWTLESMTADIGMGEFEDLLIRTQSPEPLVWLIAALNRMQHLKLWRPLSFGDFNQRVNGVLLRTIEDENFFTGHETDFHDDEDVRMQQSWVSSSAFLRNPSMAVPPQVAWAVNNDAFVGFLSRRLKKTTNITLHPLLATGSSLPPLAPINQRRAELSVRCIDYQYRMVVFGYNGPDFVVKIGSAPETNVGRTHTGNTILMMESEEPDLDFSGNQSTDLELLTAVPTTIPFEIPDPDENARISVIVSHAWVYCDLPEIMGAGELTAPQPTVSAIAEQEE